MSTTVVVTFRARPGRVAELASFLRGLHAELPSHAGFESISLHRDEGAPDRLVEIERWADAAAHRRMVEAVDARDGWRALDELVGEEPVTVYLAPA